MLQTVVRLETHRPNIAFMVMSALYFHLQHPDAVVRIPIKMTRVLFGSGMGVSTVRLLQRLTWKTEEVESRAVFYSVLPDQAMKVKACDVVFQKSLFEFMRDRDPQCCQEGFFQGMTDVTELAFRYAGKEIAGDFDGWTPSSIEKMFLSELVHVQTPKGSTMARKVKYCPVCRKPIGRLFYGSMSDLKKLLGGIRLEDSSYIIGNTSDSEPRPLWMCPACQLKIWGRKSSDQSQ